MLCGVQCSNNAQPLSTNRISVVQHVQAGICLRWEFWRQSIAKCDEDPFFLSQNRRGTALLQHGLLSGGLQVEIWCSFEKLNIQDLEAKNK